MSATSPPAPRSSPRLTPVRSLAEAARGAPAGALELPAGTYLENLPWEGPAPDPDVLEAAAFLAWL